MISPFNIKYYEQRVADYKQRIADSGNKETKLVCLWIALIVFGILFTLYHDYCVSLLEERGKSQYAVVTAIDRRGSQDKRHIYYDYEIDGEEYSGNIHRFLGDSVMSVGDTLLIEYDSVYPRRHWACMHVPTKMPLDRKEATLYF